MENLSTDVEQLPRFAIIGEPGLGLFVSPLSSTQAVLARLIGLVAHPLVRGCILLDILEALWLANGEQDSLDLVE